MHENILKLQESSTAPISYIDLLVETCPICKEDLNFVLNTDFFKIISNHKCGNNADCLFVNYLDHTYNYVASYKYNNTFISSHKKENKTFISQGINYDYFIIKCFIHPNDTEKLDKILLLI